MSTAFLVGLVLSAAVFVFARRTALERDRAFYPTVLIVVASYYVLFAAQAGSMRALLSESAVMSVFVVCAVVGFKRAQWLVIAGLAAHGVMDGFHGALLTNPGVPDWWPGFCGAYDVGAALLLAVARHKSQLPASRKTGRG